MVQAAGALSGDRDRGVGAVKSFVLVIMNDLRIPIGSFFLLVGVILAITGIVADYQARLESANVNLYCGASMLIFGAVMLWLAWRKSRS
jgi:hypothetical protein